MTYYIAKEYNQKNYLSKTITPIVKQGIYFVTDDFKLAVWFDNKVMLGATVKEYKRTHEDDIRGFAAIEIYK